MSIYEQLHNHKRGPVDWSFYKYNRNKLLAFIAGGCIAGGIISFILRLVLLYLR